MKKLIDDLMRARNYTVELFNAAVKDLKDVVSWIFILFAAVIVLELVILYKVF